jgi:transcriptional regulator with XRE-family HTH domain
VRTRSVLRALGEEVRERRKHLRLSQEKLADLADIHMNVVGRLERGEYNPTVKLLAKVALRLDTSLSDLFTGAEKRQ